MSLCDFSRQAESFLGLSFWRTGSMMELQTLQEALKVEIQVHQVGDLANELNRVGKTILKCHCTLITRVKIASQCPEKAPPLL